MAAVARHLAGLGLLPESAPPPPRPAERISTDVAVVGAGAAGWPRRSSSPPLAAHPSSSSRRTPSAAGGWSMRRRTIRPADGPSAPGGCTAPPRHLGGRPLRRRAGAGAARRAAHARGSAGSSWCRPVPSSSPSAGTPRCFPSRTTTSPASSAGAPAADLLRRRRLLIGDAPVVIGEGPQLTALARMFRREGAAPRLVLAHRRRRGSRRARCRASRSGRTGGPGCTGSPTAKPVGASGVSTATRSSSRCPHAGVRAAPAGRVKISWRPSSRPSRPRSRATAARRRPASGPRVTWCGRAAQGTRRRPGGGRRGDPRAMTPVLQLSRCAALALLARPESPLDRRGVAEAREEGRGGAFGLLRRGARRGPLLRMDRRGRERATTRAPSSRSSPRAGRAASGRSGTSSTASASPPPGRWKLAGQAEIDRAKSDGRWGRRTIHPAAPSPRRISSVRSPRQPARPEVLRDARPHQPVRHPLAAADCEAAETRARRLETFVADAWRGKEDPPVSKSVLCTCEDVDAGRCPARDRQGLPGHREHQAGTPDSGPASARGRPASRLCPRPGRAHRAPAGAVLPFTPRPPLHPVEDVPPRLGAGGRVGSARRRPPLVQVGSHALRPAEPSRPDPGGHRRRGHHGLAWPTTSPSSDAPRWWCSSVATSAPGASGRNGGGVRMQWGRRSTSSLPAAPST
jgi:hypothetical protein